MQPIVLDDAGIARFRENAVVRFLVDELKRRGFSLNELDRERCRADWSREDWSQLMQLIGYSVSGYGDHYWPDVLGEETLCHLDEADAAVKALLARKPT